MKVGDLIKIVTYRNSGEAEAIGVFLGWSIVYNQKRGFVYVDGRQDSFLPHLLEVIA